MRSRASVGVVELEEDQLLNEYRGLVRGGQESLSDFLKRWRQVRNRALTQGAIEPSRADVNDLLKSCSLSAQQHSQLLLSLKKEQEEKGFESNAKRLEFVLSELQVFVKVFGLRDKLGHGEKVAMIGESGAKFECFNCGGDHFARDCPDGPSKGKSKGSSKGGGKSKSAKGGNKGAGKGPAKPWFSSAIHKPQRGKGAGKGKGAGGKGWKSGKGAKDGAKGASKGAGKGGDDWTCQCGYVVFGRMKAMFCPSCGAAKS